MKNEEWETLKPNIKENIFIEQSRRDKTHEVLITPHKAIAAVWGRK